MAAISIRKVREYTDSLQNWLAIGESPAKECLVLQFTKDDGEQVIDEERVNQTLYLQSMDGNVAIDFDSNGLIVSIEIS